MSFLCTCRQCLSILLELTGRLLTPWRNVKERECSLIEQFEVAFEGLKWIKAVFQRQPYTEKMQSRFRPAVQRQSHPSQDGQVVAVSSLSWGRAEDEVGKVWRPVMTQKSGRGAQLQGGGKTSWASKKWMEGGLLGIKLGGDPHGDWVNTAKKKKI